MRQLRYIDLKRFVESFMAHSLPIMPYHAGCLMAVRSKHPRHIPEDGEPSKSISLISASADDYGLTVGPFLVDRKKNEITASPTLLRRFDLASTTRSLDFMGCQKNIAQEIRISSADKVLALQANHGNLYVDIAALFDACGFLLVSR